MNYHDLIVRDPKVCGGEPVIRGTRVTLRTVLASFAHGDNTEDILQDFPTLTEEQIKAVIAFAAATAIQDTDQAQVHPVAGPRDVLLQCAAKLRA